jgi:hypothetical protein
MRRRHPVFPAVNGRAIIGCPCGTKMSSSMNEKELKAILSIDGGKKELPR